MVAGGSVRRRRPTTTAVHLLDQVMLRVALRQGVLSLPILLRLLLAAQPKLITQMLQGAHRVITHHLRRPAGLKAEEADSGAASASLRPGQAPGFCAQAPSLR